MLNRLKISSYAKVIFTLTFILIFASVATLVITIINSFNIIKAANFNDLDIINYNVEEYIKEKLSDLNMLSAFLSQNINNKETIASMFHNMAKSSTVFYSFSYINNSSYQVFSSPPNHPYDKQTVLDVVKSNPDEYNFYLSSLNSKSSMVSPITPLSDKNFGLSLSVPVNDQYTGNQIGILIGRIDFDLIRESPLFFSSENSQSSAFVVTPSGEIIFSPLYSLNSSNNQYSNNQYLSPTLNIDIIKNMQNGLSGLSVFKTRIGNNQSKKPEYKLIWYRPVKYKEHFLFSLAITTPLKQMAFFLLNALIEIFFIVVSGLSIIYFVKRIHKKSLKQEIEKSRVIMELNIANDIIEKDKTIHLQKEQIEEQNKRIIEQKNLVDKLYKEALENSKIKTEFFSDIAHELKTPLSIILSTIQLISSQIKKDEQTNRDRNNLLKYLNIVKMNSYRIVRLINSLLQISKIEAGYNDIMLQNYDIVKVVRDICFSVSEYLAQKDIVFEFRTNIEKKTIAIDYDKFERIILNLLSNAAKFTPSGGKIIVCLSEKKNELLISVKDTGSGIPPEKLGSIFDRFKQARTYQTNHCEGVGIGLSLVKMLVEIHNGRIEVKSKVGEGTEFFVYLPVLKINQSQIANSPLSNSSILLDRLNIEFSELQSLN